MKLRNKILIPCLLLIGILSAQAQQKGDSITIYGTIYTQDSVPMSAVILEQLQSLHYAITDVNGNYTIKLSPRGLNAVRVKYIGYTPIIVSFDNTTDRRVDFYMKKETKQPVRVEDEKRIQRTRVERAIPEEKTRLYALGFRFGYSYFPTSFDSYSALTSSDLEILNKNDHYFNFEVSLFVRNIGLTLDWNVAPHMKNHDLYSQANISRSNHFFLKAGYLFPVYRSVFFVTPHVGFGHSYYFLASVPEKYMKMSDYWLDDTYNHITFSQFSGLVGVTFDYRLFELNSKIKNGLFLSSSIGYAFKLQKNANVSAYDTPIYTEETYHQKGLFVQVGLRYLIHYNFRMRHLQR